MTERKDEPMTGQLALKVLGEDEAPLAFHLPAELTFEQWEAEGRRLSFTSHALQWYIGDWWNAGERFGDERRSETAQRLFGLEYGTVRNYGSVAARVGLSHRYDSLPFTHYIAVASAPAETMPSLIQKAIEESLTVRELRQEVAALRGQTSNVVPIKRAVAEPVTEPVAQNDLNEAYGRYIEAMEALQSFRPLTNREADFMTLCLEHLGIAHAERRPVPDDFRVIFVEQGRLACETWYRASRITINRWLLQSGKKALIDERAAFVKFQRSGGKTEAEAEANTPAIDTYLPVATLAAQFLRIARYGGWRISRCDQGGWIVGTAKRTSQELIAMAERMGFDTEAAKAEAREEGY